MTDNVNLGTLKTADLAQYDFGNIRETMNDKIRGLLDQEGAFSLDSRGELIVVNPPKKRDNCIYRFFKGLFNSRYKEQQQQFDKVTALQKNASFNTILRENLTRSIDAGKSSGVPEEAAPEKEQRVSAMLTDLFNWKSNKVTLKDVKLMTFAEESGKGKAGIFVKGEVLAPAEFIEKYASHLKPGNNDSHMTHAILSRIAAHPEDFACLGMEKKAAALNTLMSQPGTRGSQTKINQLLQDIMAEINDKMSAFAENALSSGKDANAVARKLADIYDRLCSPATGNQKTDRAFMTKIFGENGSLSRIGNLEKAADPQSYARTDPGFRCSGAMTKIKEQLPDLTDKQLGEIVRSLSGSYQKDISDDAITQFVNIKNALPQLKETQLLQVFDHLSSHGTKEITPEALKQYADIFKAQRYLLLAIRDLESHNPLQAMRGIARLSDLFRQVTGMAAAADKTEMAGQMKEFFSHTGHVLSLACSGNSMVFSHAGVKPEELTALSGLKTAFKNSLNTFSASMSPEFKSSLEHKLSFAEAFLNEIRDHMRTGSNHTGIIDPDAEPAPKMKETADQAVRLAILKEDKGFNEKLDQAVNELNMKDARSRDVARLMIRDLVFCGLAKDKDPMAHYENVITDVTGKIKDDEAFLKLLSLDSMTPDHLKTVVNKIASKEIISRRYEEQLESPQKAVTPTAIHSAFLRDILGPNIKIGDTDLDKFQGDSNRKAGAAEAFSRIVPEKFRGFVSTFMMQTGIPNILYHNIYDIDVAPQDRIHPLIPDSTNLTEQSKSRLQISVDAQLAINRRKDDILEIRTVINLNGAPGRNFNGIKNLTYLSNENNDAYRLKTFEMVHTIDLKAGVADEKGIPRDMKLESLTVKDALPPADLDF